MSIHRSYFSKNNTIFLNNLSNTGRNPVVDLYFGSDKDNVSFSGYSRFIFDLNLDDLKEKISDGTISTQCNDDITHTLHMTNTIKFDDDLLNSLNSVDRKRASSFDLILFRIPLGCYQNITHTTTEVTTRPRPTPTPSPVITTTTFDPCFTSFSQSILSTITTNTTTCDPRMQYWDEGVGYDELDNRQAIVTSAGQIINLQPVPDTSFSIRPSNWFQTTNLGFWSEPGIYSNTNTSPYVNYDDLIIIDIQHFDKGNEDISFDMTNEINGVLNGSITGVTGWGIAYRPEFETYTGITSYSVSFFSRHTQTFYEPYLETTYDDLIQDDRNLFVEKKQNKLYLFSYIDGDLVNLDMNPMVTILDPNGDPISSLTNLPTCPRTKGVYEVTIPPMSGYNTPCMFSDVWSNIVYEGQPLPDIEYDFTLYPYKKRMIIGAESKEPEIYGFDFYGIKQDERILNTDMRKIGVSIKKAYTTKQLLQNINASYRVFVREGLTEVQVQDWTKINRTFNEYYFMFDTRDKVPNEYFIDIKVNTSGESNTYKRTLKFLIVNKK